VTCVQFLDLASIRAIMFILDGQRTLVNASCIAPIIEASSMGLGLQMGNVCTLFGWILHVTDCVQSR
jgi:hypothetical protein